jgi:hypothetical protein
MKSSLAQTLFPLVMCIQHQHHQYHASRMACCTVSGIEIKKAQTLHDLVVILNGITRYVPPDVSELNLVYNCLKESHCVIIELLSEANT